MGKVADVVRSYRQWETAGGYLCDHFGWKSDDAAVKISTGERPGQCSNCLLD